LQTVLTAIVSDENFRAAVAIQADDAVVVMTLDALHVARKYAKAQGLPV